MRGVDVLQCTSKERNEDPLVFLHRRDYDVHGFDTRDLSERWNVSVGEIMSEELGPDDSGSAISRMKFSATLDGLLVATDHTGNWRWRSELGSTIHGLFLITGSQPYSLPKRYMRCLLLKVL